LIFLRMLKTPENYIGRLAGLWQVMAPRQAVTVLSERQAELPLFFPLLLDGHRKLSWGRT